MRNLISVSIFGLILIIVGSAVAGEYWRFGLGFRGTAVVPGDDYSSAFGVGAIAAFGDPDSKFNTQIEFDSWKVVYDYWGSDTEFRGREFHYSGLGFGVYEKYRIFDITSRFSPYVLAGPGAYFLELKREEMTDIVGLQLRSKYIHSLFSISGAVGVEARLRDKLGAFVEGRYVSIFSAHDEDKDLIQSYVGVKYNF